MQKQKVKDADLVTRLQEAGEKAIPCLGIIAAIYPKSKGLTEVAGQADGNESGVTARGGCDMQVGHAPRSACGHMHKDVDEL